MVWNGRMGWAAWGLVVALAGCGESDEIRMPPLDIDLPGTRTLATLDAAARPPELETVCEGVEDWANDPELFDFENDVDCIREAIAAGAECQATLDACRASMFYYPGAIDRNCNLATLTPDQIASCPATLADIEKCMKGVAKSASASARGFRCGSATTAEQITASTDPVQVLPSVAECAGVPAACLEVLFSL